MSRIKQWLGIDDSKDKELFNQLIELAKKDPDLMSLADSYAQFDTPGQRHTAIRILQILLDK